MPKRFQSTEPVEETPEPTPEDIAETDKAEYRRLILVTRPGEHAGRKRSAFVITLESGREIILIVPERTATELAKMHGYVGRIRPARDDDHVQIDQPRQKGE